MQQLFLSGFEAVLNQYLRLDPDTIQRLALLQGKVICIELTDWNSQFFVLPQTNGLQLAATAATEANVTIKGKLSSLTRAGLAKGEGAALFANKIEITGDTALGEEMRAILQKLDIDWEEHLSRIVGDESANKIFRAGRGVIDFLTDTGNKLKNKLSEYLQHEAHYFPTHEQLNRFNLDVSTLRNDVERAESRIKLLQQRKDTK